MEDNTWWKREVSREVWAIVGRIIVKDIIGKLPSLNEVIGANRKNVYLGNKLKQQVQEMIMPQILELPAFEEPIEIVFCWQEPNKRRDADNVTSAKKFILDALQKAGKLINDTQKYVSVKDIGIWNIDPNEEPKVTLIIFIK